MFWSTAKIIKIVPVSKYILTYCNCIIKSPELQPILRSLLSDSIRLINFVNLIFFQIWD